MKRILVLISEFGAKQFFSPIITELLKKKNQIDLLASPILLELFKKSYKDYLVNKQLRIFSDSECNNLKISKYSLVISSATGKKNEFQLIKNAKNKSIPTLQFIDNIYGWKKRLSYKREIVLPENLTVINKECVKLVRSQGILVKNIFYVGHPAWENISEINLRSNRKTFFIGSPINNIYKNKLGYTEREVWNICIKVEKNYPGLIKGLKYLAHPAQKIPPYVSKNKVIKNIDDIKFFGQVLGIFSSYLTDAYLEGKNVLSIQPRVKKNDRWIISRFYKKRVINTYKELINELSIKSLKKSNLNSDLIDSKKRIINIIKSII